MSRAVSCRKILEFASTYLDGRMSPQASAAYEQHLDVCPGCASELNALRLVSRRTGALPNSALQHGLADKVRKAAHATSRDRPWAISSGQAAAAVLLISGALFGAYLFGRQQGQNDAARRSDVAVSSPTNRVIDESSSDREAEALRAAQGLIADLAFIDQVPDELRRPLLQAQLDHFELDDWADRQQGDDAMRPIADMLHRLNHALSRDPDARSLTQLQGEAQQGDLWRSFEEARGLPAPVVNAADHDPNMLFTADRFAPDLGEESLHDLRTVMQIKDSWVRGRHRSVIRSFEEIQSPRGSRTLRTMGPSLSLVAGSSFADAGLLRESKNTLDPLESDAHEWMRSMMDSFVGGARRNPGMTRSRDRLRDLFGSDPEGTGEREIHVEESYEDGHYSYRVTIRSQSSSSSGSASSSGSSSSSTSGAGGRRPPLRTPPEAPVNKSGIENDDQRF